MGGGKGGREGKRGRTWGSALIEVQGGGLGFLGSLFIGEFKSVVSKVSYGNQPRSVKQECGGWEGRN